MSAVHQTFLLNDTRTDRHHGCSIVMRNLLDGLARRGIAVNGTLPCGKRLAQDPAASAAFAAASRVIINGEGTLHHDRPYARYLLQTAAAAIAAGKTVWLVNASWEANSPELTGLLAGAAGIYVRDSASAAELAAGGVAATVVPDLTFATQYEPAPADGGPLLVSDSVFAETSAQLMTLAARLDARYLPIIQAPPLTGPYAAPGKWLKARSYGALARLSLGAYRPRQYYRDLAFCESDTGQFLRQLAGARAIVSGRYHATCLALQHRLPLVCLASNTRKVENLLSDAGLDAARHLCSLAQLSGMSAGEVLAAADYTASEARALASFLASAQARIDAMLDAIAGKA